MRDEEEITHWVMVFGKEEVCFGYWRLVARLNGLLHSVSSLGSVARVSTSFQSGGQTWHNG